MILSRRPATISSCINRQTAERYIRKAHFVRRVGATDLIPSDQLLMVMAKVKAKRALRGDSGGICNE